MECHKKLKLDVLRESARLATRTALSAYPHLAEVPIEDVVVGTFWEDDAVLFELYIPAERPDDVLILTTARVDVYSGEVLSVQVHEDAWHHVARHKC